MSYFSGLCHHTFTYMLSFIRKINVRVLEGNSSRLSYQGRTESAVPILWKTRKIPVTCLSNSDTAANIVCMTTFVLKLETLRKSSFQEITCRRLCYASNPKANLKKTDWIERKPKIVREGSLTAKPIMSATKFATKIHMKNFPVSVIILEIFSKKKIKRTTIWLDKYGKVDSGNCCFRIFFYVMYVNLTDFSIISHSHQDI